MAAVSYDQGREPPEFSRFCALALPTARRWCRQPLGGRVRLEGTDQPLAAAGGYTVNRPVTAAALALTIGMATVPAIAATCTHACNPCDYAPGSGAQVEYDRYHSVKLTKKCHWSPSQVCWSLGKEGCPID